MAASPLVEKLYCAPGNAGIAQECELVALDVSDHAAVIAFCRTHKIGLVVVGPEAPLCAGIVDDLEAAGIKAFGPSRIAAQLEGSKGFTKDLCRSAGIPTAAYERFRLADPDTMTIETTITDRDALKAPYISNMTLKRHRDWTIAEYICEENNRNSVDASGKAGIDLTPPGATRPK